MLFQLGKHARFVGWITSVSRQSSKAQTSQKTWLPRQCHCNIKWYIHGTWFSNNPLIHMVCVLWHHFAKTRHHHSHCWCPILASPLLLDAVLRLCSLYGYITGHGKHTLNDIWLEFSMIFVLLTFNPVHQHTDLKIATFSWCTCRTENKSKYPYGTTLTSMMMRVAGTPINPNKPTEQTTEASTINTPPNPSVTLLSICKRQTSDLRH